MSTWACDTCPNRFDDYEDHTGHSCNRCDEGTISEVYEDFEILLPDDEEN